MAASSYFIVSNLLACLETAIGYQFRERALLEQALTHRSYGNNHYERLEFLGDAILNAVIAQALFHNFPALPEGDLSRLRSSLVCQEQLVSIAAELGISDYLRLGDGERKSGGHRKPSILADNVEALYGAIWQDANFEIARQVILRTFNQRLKSIDVNKLSSAKDAKTRLQEWLQSRGVPLPVYRILKSSGAAHAKWFEVTCRIVDPKIETQGRGLTRRAAEQQAAALALVASEAHYKEK